MSTKNVVPLSASVKKSFEYAKPAVTGLSPEGSKENVTLEVVSVNETVDPDVVIRQLPCGVRESVTVSPDSV